MSELAKALHAFQGEVTPIRVDSINPHFGNRFISLAAVRSAIGPALTKHGLCFSQLPTNIDGAPALKTVLIHAESGEQMSADAPLILAKQDPQGYGSALTYARRYALLSILGLVADEDDDANSTQIQSRPGVASNSSAGSSAASDRDSQPAENPADIIVHWGNDKGKRLGDLSDRSLDYFATKWTPNPQFATDLDYQLKAAAELLAGLKEPVGAGAPDDTDGIPF